jgi:hypothetical protein
MAGLDLAIGELRRPLSSVRTSAGSAVATSVTQGLPPGVG